jgi:GNAT superfamily N-acetyltransferase
VVAIEMLLPVAADDPALVAEIAALVNRAYDVAEEGLWRGGVARTTITETSDAISAEEVVVARDHGRIVGAIRTRQLDRETGWFGVLAVDQANGGRGIGGKLVAFAESRASSTGASRMQLELLVPVTAHPHTERLAAWYGRLGYHETERRELADVEPSAVPFLALHCHVAVMRKHLAAPVG